MSFCFIRRIRVVFMAFSYVIVTVSVNNLHGRWPGGLPMFSSMYNYCGTKSMLLIINDTPKRHHPGMLLLVTIHSCFKLLVQRSSNLTTSIRRKMCQRHFSMRNNLVLPILLFHLFTVHTQHLFMVHTQRTLYELLWITVTCTHVPTLHFDLMIC